MTNILKYSEYFVYKEHTFWLEGGMIKYKESNLYAKRNLKRNQPAVYSK